MASSNSNNGSADGPQIPGLKIETFAATIDHRNMLEEFGRKYHAIGIEAGHSKGIEAGHAMGVQAGLAQAEGEIELRIASAVEESQEIISELLEKRTQDIEVDVDLANEARNVIYTLVSSVDDLIQLPGIPMETYNKIREKCESLESIRDKFSKRLGKDPFPILRKRRSDAVETRRTLRVKREKN
ncbi:Ff.00g036940.m01.CDS01 [Fusarium sp. VM40]|nr:Ff.00g036940.m01.CDS01 [Fusarium sp. VM40]